MLTRLYEAETPRMLRGGDDARVELLFRLIRHDETVVRNGLILEEEDGSVVGYGALSPGAGQRRPTPLGPVLREARALLGTNAALTFVGGYAKLQSLVCAPLPADTAQLHSLVVDPALRGRGLGQQLVGRLEDGARRTGHRAVLLYCLEGNPAVRLYQRHGYRHTSTPPIAGPRRFLRHPGSALVKSLTADATESCAWAVADPTPVRLA
nr:GNAT family N-acetyltransferase [Streptomyces sp. SID3343]